ncbi:hypothetical protein ACFZCP_33915 [Streptomyces sp. NPDC007971]|uniref:hypothetical protein n=1 Tax=Streptomyces sp. NPDC007971 TaxID=3364799 RepID=UPI0036ECA276
MPISVVLTLVSLLAAMALSALVAVGAALLARADGESPAACVTRAGVAFGATLTLMAMVTASVAGLFT